MWKNEVTSTRSSKSCTSTSSTTCGTNCHVFLLWCDKRARVASAFIYEASQLPRWMAQFKMPDFLLGLTWVNTSSHQGLWNLVCVCAHVGVHTHTHTHTHCAQEKQTQLVCCDYTQFFLGLNCEPCIKQTYICSHTHTHTQWCVCVCVCVLLTDTVQCVVCHWAYHRVTDDTNTRKVCNPSAHTAQVCAAGAQ